MLSANCQLKVPLESIKQPATGYSKCYHGRFISPRHASAERACCLITLSECSRNTHSDHTAERGLGARSDNLDVA